MEKLKTGIMLYALREILNHPSQLLEDNVNQKDIQESIYQLEDMIAGKAFLKNKLKNNKYYIQNGEKQSKRNCKCVDGTALFKLCGQNDTIGNVFVGLLRNI